MGIAQVEAPDLGCIRNDSLFWDLPLVTCGAVSAYQIWVSEDQNGPYTMLTEITDLSLTNYFADNPGNLLRYFYMTSVADCTGEPVLSSDTLDNRSPEMISIDYVSVEDGDVHIYWQSLIDPDLVGYIIYKVTNLGTVPVDTIGGNSYTDPDASAGTQTEFYYVNALDACGNTSFFDEPHNTILLEYSIDICDQSAILNWNTYENWTNGVEKYLVHLSTNGRTFEQIGETTAAGTSFKVPDLKRDTIYNLRISAIESITGFESFSNEVSFNPNVTEGVDPFVLYNADIDLTGDITLEWFWGGDVNTDSVFLNVFDLTNSTDVMVNQRIAGLNPGGEFQSFVVNGLSPQTNQYAFSLMAFNTCNKGGQSNTLTTIQLRGSFDNNTATLNWNQNNMNVDVQQILVDQNGTFDQLVILSADRQTYNHIWAESDATNCYMVSDSGQVTGPSGMSRTFTQRSNIECIFRSLNIYIPNAFAPGGVNQEFIPYFSSTALIKAYQFDIYDQWGGKVFSTDNFLLGWNGYTNDKLLPSDIYTYMLDLTTISDEKVIRTGDVLLIR
jgi:hypothetical protein